jgi:hypothetical protein
MPLSMERMDKTVLTVSSLAELDDDREYWWSRTPAERLEALEYLRQMNYGYDPIATRLQRVLEIVERSSS